jgi:hypothetical protein
VRTAEEEARTFAAKLALSAPPSNGTGAPLVHAANEAPVPGSRMHRLYATPRPPALGEEPRGTPGTAHGDAERAARAEIWRYAPLDCTATSRITDPTEMDLCATRQDASMH